MSNQKETDAATLQQMAKEAFHADDARREVLERIAYQLESDAKRYADSEKLQDIGRSAFESIAEMVAALECDYDRLEELREEVDALKVALEEAITARDNPTELTSEAEHADAELSEAVRVAKDALASWKIDNDEELAELIAAAGECEGRDDAEQRIQEDPLSVMVRDSQWQSPNELEYSPDEFEILLGTGGPATRIIGELSDGEPSRARLQTQDWGTPWTDYRGGDSETLLTYCRCFYFGES